MISASLGDDGIPMRQEPILMENVPTIYTHGFGMTAVNFGILMPFMPSKIHFCYLC